MNKSRYISASTGSLGHGLPIISGMAFADQLNNLKKILRYSWRSRMS